MTVRTCVLANGRAAANVAATSVAVYTCPVGRTAIVKEVVFELFDGAGAAHLEVEHVGGSQTRMWSPGLAAPGPARINPWTVLEPGDTLVWVKNANTGEIRWYLSGTELDGVAP